MLYDIIANNPRITIEFNNSILKLLLLTNISLAHKIIAIENKTTQPISNILINSNILG